MPRPPIATKTRPALTVIGGTVLALVLMWIFAFSPTLEKKSDAEAGLQAATDNNSSLAIQVAKLKNVAKDKALLSAQVAEFVKQFPSSADQAGTFKAIQDAAKSAGVDITSFTSAVPVQATVAVSPGATPAPAPAPVMTTAGGAPDAPTFPIAEVDVSIAVTGDMTQLVNFVAALDHMDRPVLVNGVTLAGAESVKSSTSLSLRVFIAKPLDNPTTPAVATSAAAVPTS